MKILKVLLLVMVMWLLTSHAFARIVEVTLWNDTDNHYLALQIDNESPTLPAGPHLNITTNTTNTIHVLSAIENNQIVLQRTVDLINSPGYDWHVFVRGRK